MFRLLGCPGSIPGVGEDFRQLARVLSVSVHGIPIALIPRTPFGVLRGCNVGGDGRAWLRRRVPEGESPNGFNAM